MSCSTFWTPSVEKRTTFLGGKAIFRKSIIYPFVHIGRNARIGLIDFTIFARNTEFNGINDCVDFSIFSILPILVVLAYENR